MKRNRKHHQKPNSFVHKHRRILFIGAVFTVLIAYEGIFKANAHEFVHTVAEAAVAALLEGFFPGAGDAV